MQLVVHVTTLIFTKVPVIHKWQICGDLKILSMILGQHSGFTKYPCYLCMFDSRDRENHYKKKIWPSRESFKPRKQNIVKEPLVDLTKILIPPLHIKLGLIKQCQGFRQRWTML